MTKEERIKEAYSEYWQESKSFINENGWMNAKEWLGGIGNTQIFNKLKGIELECMDNYDPKYCYWFRPKSLQGIENNNGWIKIEREDDLPKESGFYYVVDSETGNITDRFFSDDDNGYFYTFSSHYQAIQKPKPPIY